MKERDDTSVVENDGTVLPGDRLAPPLVVDAPTLAHDRHSTGRLARETDMHGFAVFVRAHGHEAGLT